jgi:hypothetical protein
VEQTLYVDSKIGDFISFLSTDSGFGNVVYKNGNAELQVVYGKLPIHKVVISTHTEDIIHATIQKKQVVVN